MHTPPQNLKEFSALLEIVKALRAEDGCPWDKEQTHRTLTPFAIEESHELAEAIEAGNEAAMISELGDLLLQVVLHAEIGRGANRFDISDVILAVSQKMVSRHPHVFGSAQVKDSAEVLRNWDELKKKEKAAGPTLQNSSKNRFDVPVSLPALARAHKIGNKTKAVKFDWPTPRAVLSKVEEEVTELTEAFDQGTQCEQEHEIGDVLFSVAQLARHLGLEAEQCLRTANQRFEGRFFAMQELIREDGNEMRTLSSEELEKYWQKVKEKEKVTT